MQQRYNIHTLATIILASGCMTASVLAQGLPGMPAAGSRGTASRSGVSADGLKLKFSNTPLEIVLQDYSEKTGKTLLRAPGLPAPTFTLRSQGELTLEEYLKAVETVLGMHGIGLVPKDEKFMQVVPIAKAISEGSEIHETLVDGVLLENSNQLISQMIVLKHIDVAEATSAIQMLRHEYGKINPFERTNSILVTDTPANINRMLQIIRFIDQPIESREEPSVIQIYHAKASDIKKKLEEIIAESQKDQQKSTVPKQNRSGAPGVTRAPPGVIRARVTASAALSTPTPVAALIAEAERGIIRGKVKIVADERTNKLIIITRPENMSFFKQIIAVLDIETSPDVTVKVVRLEFAEAKEIAGMLNDLIGATDKDDVATTPAKDAVSGEPEAKALREYVASLKSPEPQIAKKSSVGELSKDNIKILADERTNALIIMASKGDLVTILEIIKDMDMMLSQVLIEAVIIDVTLGDSLDTGVSWIQKSLTAYEKNAAGLRSPVVAFAGGGGAGDSAPDAAGLSDASLTTSGLGYFFTMFDLNINAVIRASSTDSRAKVVSTPALLTTDNTDAELSSTDRIYVYDGQARYNTGVSTTSTSANYKQEDIGLKLTVTPHINENHIVMMEIEQEISTPGSINPGSTTDNLTGQVISSARKIKAEVAVRSGQTIVLGGQVRESSSRSRTKIPFLGDIPLIGRLFNSDSRSKGRTETIVFITPYVLDTPEEVEAETRRRKDSLNIGGMWKRGWSGSDMAEPGNPEKPKKPEPAARYKQPRQPEPTVRYEQPRTPQKAVRREDEPAPVVRHEDPVEPAVYRDDMALDDSLVDSLVGDARRDMDASRLDRLVREAAAIVEPAPVPEVVSAPIPEAPEYVDDMALDDSIFKGLITEAKAGSEN